MWQNPTEPQNVVNSNGKGMPTMAVDADVSQLPQDAANRSIQVAHQIQMRDNSGTPKESPLTVSSSVLELVPPVNAVVLHLIAATNNLRFGDNAVLDGTAGDGYGIVTSGNSVDLACADGTSIHVLKDGASDVIMSFWFDILG